jgi:ceramide glucosyltransferase
LVVSLAHLSVAMSAFSLAMYATMMALFVRAIRRRPKADACPWIDPLQAPRVSVLKPLAGCDDDLEENLESFACQSYPNFEILLGLTSTSDAAYPVARRFIARHPRLDVRVVLTDPDAAINPKVAQLMGLERAASGAIYIISDSNVRVAPSYLASMVSELAREGVGIVTSVFVGSGERTLGAALENLHLCASSAPGLLAMNTVCRYSLVVGKSMGLRPGDLARLGGFASVGDFLAEDQVLGRRFQKAGLAARTSVDVVENRNVACSLARTLERHARWAKLRRWLFPQGFAFEPLLSPVVVASVGWLVAPSTLTALVLAGVYLFQSACAFGAVALARGSAMSWWYAPLEIVRSYLALFCWFRGWGTRRVSWRGHPFELGPGSVIARVPPQPERSAGSAGLAA